MINIEEYIVKKKITKRSDIQINIPTFNSYEVTRDTVSRLLNEQKGINFDILIIDNASHDGEKLMLDFPEINYVLLKKNTGSSGAHYIGTKLALELGYEYIIFTDNDVLLLDERGLAKMKGRLDSNKEAVAIVPRYVDAFAGNYSEDFILKNCCFHYLFVKADVFQKTELHNFHLFLYSDDMSLTLKLSEIGKIIVCHDVPYFHYSFSPKSVQNYYLYYYIRGLLTIVFREKQIGLKAKIGVLFWTAAKISQMIFHSIKFLDFSYIKTLGLAAIGFINIGKDYSSLIPKNKYCLAECEPPEKSLEKYFVKISAGSIRLFYLPSRCYIYSHYHKKNTYYKLVKTKS